MGKGKARLAVYTLAGIYLIYLAYQMLQNVEQSAAGMERGIVYLAAALFALLGIGIMGFSAYVTWKSGSGKKD